MTNRELLEAAIKRSGYRKRYLAELLGLSPQGFYNKLNNKTEFTQSEIATLVKKLCLFDLEREAIFFAEKVDKGET
jgi:DNA-binding XRE family transcriptional regulator